MRKILIAGANSYIGTSFEHYICGCDDSAAYKISTVDMQSDSWKLIRLTDFDTVFYVAGIVHKKETRSNAHLYYEVNRNLTLEFAEKAKQAGVRQFIYLSTMSIYGVDTGIITKGTKPQPNTHYGLSKFQAENELIKLSDNFFKVAVLRPPMVYGQGCKGNYNGIIKLVKSFPVFPKVNNRRSAIYVDNLSRFIKIMIDEEASGIFFPQDSEYFNTSDMAQKIADAIGRKIYMSRFLGFIVRILMPFSKKAGKAFGSLIYKDTEDFNFRYCNKERRL